MKNSFIKFLIEFVIFLAIGGVVKLLLNTINITSDIPLMIYMGIGIFILFGRNESFFKNIGG
jgi:hypothetical protein